MVIVEAAEEGDFVDALLCTVRLVKESGRLSLCAFAWRTVKSSPRRHRGSHAACSFEVFVVRQAVKV